MTAYAYVVRRMWKKAGNEDLVVSFHHLGQPSAHVFRFQFLQRALRLSCNEEMTESVRWLIVFDERRYSWIFTALLNLKVFFENGKFSVLFFFFERKGREKAEILDDTEGANTKLFTVYRYRQCYIDVHAIVFESKISRLEFFLYEFSITLKRNRYFYLVEVDA